MVRYGFLEAMLTKADMDVKCFFFFGEWDFRFCLLDAQRICNYIYIWCCFFFCGWATKNNMNPSNGTSQSQDTSRGMQGSWHNICTR